jgi:predicted dehydrogenase
MAFKIALIGCGNIGSRHLQALKKTERNIEITVCEPSCEARRIGLERYNEVAENEHVQLVEMIDDYRKLPEVLDLVIIATGAGVRFEITKWVLENLNIKYLFLEKVVFQQIEHFDEIGKLLKERNVRAWVNCTRRLFGCYGEIKKMLENDEKVDMTVSGANWGMGCNSIHLLDLYKYITDFKNYSFDNTELEQELADSKRAGYKEFFGKFTIITNCGKAVFECEKDGDVSMDITFESKSFRVDINEAAKKMTIFDKADGTSKSADMDMDFTSNTTNRIVEQIIDGKKCVLVNYDESAFLHRVMLECFIDHMNKFSDEEVRLCPIT